MSCTPALLISAQTGEPLSVICQSLLAADGLHTTRRTEVLPEISQLDELTAAIRFVDGCGLGHPCVHIADRECDSVWHYRLWQQEEHLFVVRAKNQRIVKHEGQDKSLRVVVQELAEQKAFHYSREVEYKGKAATQYVAEAKVVIDRPAKPQRTKHHKGEGRRVAGCGHRITSHCESDHRRGGCGALRVVAVDEPPRGGASRC